MSTALEILGRPPITYTSAAKKNENILNELAYVSETKRLYDDLWKRRDAIQGVVRHHLRLGPQHTCVVLPPSKWMRGSFNVCVPVQVTTANSSKMVLMRCPMPHKLAESRYPGTVDEKLGCEVGAYVWMQHHCSAIRIPFLYGFGFSDSRHFSHEGQHNALLRLWRRVQRRLRSLLGFPSLSRYIANPTRHHLPTAYMLLEYVGPDVGRMLSDTWQQHQDNPDHRRRLFLGLSRLILSLASAPQYRIGSFQFHNDGTVTLTNRPLTCSTIIMENNGTTRAMQKDETYSCTEPFVADMLTLHQNYFFSNPNAVLDAADCRGQMAIHTLLHMLSHHYIKRERRYGPYALQFIDLHASNILVDDSWNVTCVIDLEWICSLPIEMLAVPYWLTGCSIDEIECDEYNKFDQVRQEFMEAFTQEEEQMPIKHEVFLADSMQEMWESKGVWFWHSIDSVNAMLEVVADHIYPRFSLRMGPKLEGMLASLWCERSDEVVEKKIQDLKLYDEELRRQFAKEA